jgi:hypothetical protein
MRASPIPPLVLGFCLFAVDVMGAAPTEAIADTYRGEGKRLVAEDLPFTETEVACFWPVYQRYQAELSQLSQRA